MAARSVKGGRTRRAQPGPRVSVIESPAAMKSSLVLRLASLLLGLAPAACGNKAGDPAPAAASAAASGSSAPAPEAPRGPLSVVLESRAPLVFAGLDNGVFIADAARTHLGRAAGDSELSDGPMPRGLPEGPGRILRAAGRMPVSVWLTYEKQKEDGKPESNPVFRLSRDSWKQLADDWKPAIASWSKNRVLAASTSSGRLKIKVVEPSLPAPPDDLPSVHLADASCEKTLVVADLAALRTGEVFAVGTCKPDTAAGAGASAKRYVAVRWPAVAAPDGGAPPAHAATLDAGPGDAGAAEPASAGPPGLVDVLPGVSVALAHEALYLRTAADAYVVGLEDTGKPPGVSRLYHFDGTTWGADALPAGAAVVRGLAGTADGALWLVTDHAIWRRASAAVAWEPVDPGPGAWETLGVSAVGGRDIWIAARRTGPDGTRDVILRTRPPRALVRWE